MNCPRGSASTEAEQAEPARQRVPRRSLGTRTPARRLAIPSPPRTGNPLPRDRADSPRPPRCPRGGGRRPGLVDPLVPIFPGTNGHPTFLDQVDKTTSRVALLL